MRKLITGAVAVTATLALAAGAVAQPDPVVLDVTASPSKAGKKKKPKNVKLGFSMNVDKPGTTVEFIEMNLPKGLKISGKGFKKCNQDDLAAGGPSACPSGSKAGPQGSASAAVVTGGAVTPLNFEVYPFVADSSTLLFYLSQVPAGVQSVVVGKITSGGRKMRISIPHELRQPAPGLDATLTGLDQTFSGKAKKNYIVSSTSCPKGGWKIGGTLIFTERADGAPVPGPESRSEKVKCKK